MIVKELFFHLRFLIFNQFFTSFEEDWPLILYDNWTNEPPTIGCYYSFDKPSPVINVRDSCSRASFRPRKLDGQPFSLSSFFTQHDMKYTRKI